MLKRNLHSAPTKVKLIAYKTLCRPRMEFAVEVRDPTANKYIQMLEIVQNKAAHFVSNLKGREGVTNEKKQLGLDPLQERLKMQRIKTLHNILGSKDTSLGELNDLINACFKEDRPQTRALAIRAERTPFLSSFVPATQLFYSGRSPLPPRGGLETLFELELGPSFRLSSSACYTIIIFIINYYNLYLLLYLLIIY